MTFLEQQIPVTIRPGSTGGPRFKTAIKELRGGGEYRNSLWANPLRMFSTSYGSRDRETIEDELLSFMMTTQGSLLGFRARDWSDYQVVDEPIGRGDGTTYYFRLTKSYGIYSRRIFKPVSDTVVVKVDGTAVPATDYLIDAENGTVVFITAPADFAQITWSGDFDTPVRFADDAMDVAMSYYKTGNVPSVDLREIRLRENIEEANYELVIDFAGDFVISELDDMFDVLDNHINTVWETTG